MFTIYMPSYVCISKVDQSNLQNRLVPIMLLKLPISYGLEQCSGFYIGLGNISILSPLCNIRACNINIANVFYISVILHVQHN